MSAMSDVLENFIVDHIFRTATWTKPTTLYVALYTTATDDADGGTEVSGGAYARAQLNPSNTNYTATQGGTSGASSGTSGHTDNAVQITFPTPSGANWGTVTHFGIHTASSGTGNRLIHGQLAVAKVINNGDPAPFFAVGELDVTFA